MDPDAVVTRSAMRFVCGASDHICRLCFASTESQEYAIEDSVRLERPYYDETVTFMDMFFELGVNMDSLLPKVICVDCAATAINSYLFRKLCSYADTQWDQTLKFLEEGLSRSESINPNIQTAYLMLKKDNNIIFTSKKRCIIRNKVSALAKIKRLLSSRTKYDKKKQKKIDIICEECGERCNSHYILSKHMKSHSKSQIPCRQCAKYFATQLQLVEHAERVHHPKTIKCSKCTKMFSTKRLLKHHESLHHVAAICKLCFVQFPSKNALRTHLDKHDVNTCVRCGKNFINRQTFKLHLKVCGNPNNKQDNYFCDVCNKSYARKNSLRTHLKTDHGFGRVLSCSWCNKKFDAVSRLRNHIVKHTRERNFHCETCGGRFVTSAALTYHSRLHTGERPFPCELCEETFLSASRRMEHKRRTHFDPTHECTVCQSKFVTGHQLRKHSERHYNPQSKLYVPDAAPPAGPNNIIFDI